MKTIAIPAKFLAPNGEVRPNLTEQERAELSCYGNLPLEEADLQQIQQDAAALESELPLRLTLRLSELRKSRVSEGFVSAFGFRVRTDSESMSSLVALRNSAKEDEDFSVLFKADGAFHSLTAQDILQISGAAVLHVQKCFSAEAAVLPLVQNGQVATEQDLVTLFEASMSA